MVTPDSWAGTRVLVTGHTGFKGSWLVLWLHALGAEVVGVAEGVPTEPSHFEQARLSELLDDRRGDVVDADLLARIMRETEPEVIFHLAAQSLVRQSYADPLATYRTNVLGTASVLDAVRSTSAIRAVVVATSDKCYANHDWPWAYREVDELGGHDPYSSSKAAAELVVAAYRSSFFSDDDSPRVATARAGNVVGGGDWAADRLIPDAIRAAAAGTVLEVRNPGARRPWQDVLDCLHGYLLLADHLRRGAVGSAWNFGPEPSATWTVGEVVDALAHAWPGGFEWSAGTGDGPHEAATLDVDATRARRTLGWAPVRSLPETLRRTAAWHAAVADGADPRAVSAAELDDFRGQVERR